MDRNTKLGEKRPIDRADEGLTRWLTTLPLTPGGIDRNVQYIFDFSLMLGHLGCPPGDRVLEIGCGARWASEWLARMGFSIVSCDINHDMLVIGQDRFERHKRAFPEHQLRAWAVAGDGEDLPFEDESFAAAFCLASLHHIPDVQRAMAEIFRVLRKGGRFVFVEAGEGHSNNVASQREMEEIGVLEQDILISDILAWAEKVGFSDVFLAPAFEPTSTIDASQWRRLGRKWGMLGAEPRLLARQVVDYARKHPAMVLVKPGGSLRQITLPCGKIVSVDAPRSVSAGQLFRVEALAANTGTLVWSCHSTIMQRNPLNQGEGGDVALGFKLRPADGSYCDRAYGRGQLRRDVLPGETIDIVSLLRAPTTQGMYRIKVDLVQEAVAWFEDLGCTPVWLELEVGPPLPGVHTDSRIPGQLTAEIHPEGGISPNGLLAVRVRNTGDTIWLNEPASETGMPPSTTGFVTLGAQLLDSARNLLNRDFYRLPLGCHIEPGQEVRLILALGDRVAGLPPGACFLKLDMVDEGIAWFESRGSKPAIVPLGKH